MSEIPASSAPSRWSTTGAVERNCARLAGELGEAELCAVVKADGYGHGAVECARAALAGGATWLAVAAAARPPSCGATSGRPDPDHGRVDGGRAGRWRSAPIRTSRCGGRGSLELVGERGRELGVRPAAPRQVRHRHGPARRARSGRGARAGRRGGGGRAPRARRPVDALRDRRRAGLGVLRRAARAASRPRRAGARRSPGRAAARRQQRGHAAGPGLPLRHGPLRDRDLRARPVPLRSRSPAGSSRRSSCAPTSPT